MTGHIPDTFINELLARIDIVDILQGRIELKRAGGNFLARCPFHSEKTPSFTVSPSKQFYHCFGCGAHGNALRFLTEYDGMHFVDAIEYLAGRIGLQVPRGTSEEDYDKSKHYHEIYETLKAATHFYHQELMQGSEREKPIQYLKNRGFNREVILDFQLGYAPQQWDALFKALAQDNTAIDLLLAAGLIITKENKPYFDRFRDRIMFPIRNRRGQVVGFGGRVIQEGNPKYLNSPETKVFSKSHELYGLYEAKTKLKKLHSLIVVEGYIDVISLSQFGIKNVVATLGTALSEKHLDILFKEVPEIIFCFDGDKPGKDAAHKVLLLCLSEMQEGRRARFMLLPEKEDPDSYIRKQGKDAFEQGLYSAKNLSDFLFESFLPGIDLQQLEGRAEYIRRIRPLIAKVPSSVLQHMLYDRLAELTKMTAERLEQSGSISTRQNSAGNNVGVNARNHNFSNRNTPYLADRRLSKTKQPISPGYKACAFLLANPAFIRYIKTPHGLEQGTEPDTLLLCAIIESLMEKPQLSIPELLEKVKIQTGLEKEISYIANFNDMIAMVPEEGQEAEFMGALKRVKERIFNLTLEALLDKAKTAPLSYEEKLELKRLLAEKEGSRQDRQAVDS